MRWGSTSVSNNVSAAQLLNIKRVSTRRNNLQWFKVPPKIWVGIILDPWDRFGGAGGPIGGGGPLGGGKAKGGG